MSNKDKAPKEVSGQTSAFDDHPGYSRAATFVAEMYGVPGAEVHLTLTGGEEYRGNLDSVIMSRITDPPIAIRFSIGGDMLIIPWHAIRTYSVR